MSLNNASAKALIWLAVIILFVGLMFDSPAGRFFSAVVAGIIALIPLCIGKSRWRIVAGLVFLLSGFFTYATFGDYQKEYKGYLRGVVPGM